MTALKKLMIVTALLAGGSSLVIMDLPGGFVRFGPGLEHR